MAMSPKSSKSLSESDPEEEFFDRISTCGAEVISLVKSYSFSVPVILSKHERRDLVAENTLIYT